MANYNYWCQTVLLVVDSNVWVCGCDACKCCGFYVWLINSRLHLPSADGHRHATLLSGRTFAAHGSMPPFGALLFWLWVEQSIKAICHIHKGFRAWAITADWPLRGTKLQLLQGANNLVLQGVFHSISRKGSFADKSKLVWYGSDEVVDAWLPALL